MTQPPRPRTLVTGGSGFIGTNLVGTLADRGFPVVNLSRGEPRDRRQMAYFCRNDILNLPELSRAVQEFSPEIIIHCAAKTGQWRGDTALHHRINTDGVRNILAAAASAPSVRRVIIASSNVVDRPTPAGPHSYIGSKKEAEGIVRNFPASRFSWCIVRPCFVWGPWFDAPFRTLFDAIGRGWYVHPGAASPLRFSGYVGNTVHQTIRLMGALPEFFDGETYYLADYAPLSVREWTNMISLKLRGRAAWSVPDWVMQTAAAAGSVLFRCGWHTVPLTTLRLNNMKRDVLDVPIGRTEAMAGPLPFTVEQGVEETIKWIMTNERALSNKINAKAQREPFGQS
jgi:GlcNAc-P-P-Und epimerase